MIFCKDVGVAQSVERRTHKPQVTGSIPVADTLPKEEKFFKIAIVAVLASLKPTFENQRC